MEQITMVYSVYCGARIAFYSDDAARPWTPHTASAKVFTDATAARDFIVNTLKGEVGTDANNFRQAYVVPLTQ